MQRRCSRDLQPSRAGVRGAPEAASPLRCGRGAHRWLWLWKEQGGGPAPPRPSRRPPTRPGRGAAGRATRSSGGADPDDALAPSLRHPGRPRAPERRPEAALQVKAGSVAGGFGLGAPEGRMQPGVQPRWGAALQAPVRGQDLEENHAGGWREGEGCSPVPWT